MIHTTDITQIFTKIHCIPKTQQRAQSKMCEKTRATTSFVKSTRSGILPSICIFLWKGARQGKKIMAETW